MKSGITIGIMALWPMVVLGLGAADTTQPSPPPDSGYRDRALGNDSPTRGAVKAKENQELLPALKGLVIAATEQSAMRLQQATNAGVEIDGFSEKETAAMRKIGESVIGKPVSLNSLERLTSRLEGIFHLQRRMFMRISFPEQEITKGVVALRICPARAGQVLLAGKPSFGARFAADAFRTKPGEVISGDLVLDDLDWLNKNSLRRASISYGDGAADDALDLTLRIRAKKPWRMYAGLDNQLSEDLGRERLYLGFQHGDVFGLDHRFTGQYTSALDFERLQGASGIYVVPLPIRHLVEFSAGYTESESDTIGPLDQSGTFTRMEMNYRVPLPRWQGVGHEWRMGLEFRNNDYLFPSGAESNVRFFQIETGWNGRRTDRFGATRLDVSLQFNPGQGVLGSEDEDYIALGASGAQSWIAMLEAERTLKLGDMAVLLGRVWGQLADSDLLSSDQLAAGGASRVRGFDDTVGYASDGLVASIELQSRVFHAGRAGDFVAASFVDGAVLERENRLDAGELLSTGVGLRWRYANHVSAKLDLGIPLVYPKYEDGDPLLHFAISTSW